MVIGVSGGPDSLYLLDVLHHQGYPLVVAHLDHQLRPESAEEAEAVRQAAEVRGLPFRLRRCNVADYAAGQGISLEEAARTQRYQFLFQEARTCGACAVAVGHTADDQVETVLMHLLRGAGLDGLCGMPCWSLPNPWSAEIPLVRPLLGVWREEILVYLAERGLHPNLDASNLDRRFYRNRLRHDLLPYLETFNPGVKAHLWQTAEALARDDELLQSLAEPAWQETLIQCGDGYLTFAGPLLHRQPEALRRRWLRRAVQALRANLRDLDYAAMQRGLAVLDNPQQRGSVDLVAGLRLFWEGDQLWLASWEADLPGQDWPQLPPGVQLSLPVPGGLTLPGGWQLTAERLELTPERLAEALSNPDPYQTWLDTSNLPLPLTVRARQPGDRLQPLGMNGQSVKIADLMVNQKLPRRARLRWPLVCTAETIVWVPGLRASHSYRLLPTSPITCHLQINRS